MFVCMRQVDLEQSDRGVRYLIDLISVFPGFNRADAEESDVEEEDSVGSREETDSQHRDRTVDIILLATKYVSIRVFEAA